MKKFLLKDMDDCLFDDLVIYDEEQDEKEIEKAVEEVMAREEWEFDDLLEALDKFGNYELTPLRNIKTFLY